MAFNEQTADRVYKILNKEKGELFERKMFGGLCFMLNGNMVCGVEMHTILLRVAPEVGERLLGQKGVKPMVQKGREFRGFIFVDESNYETEEDLQNLLENSLSLVRTLPEKKK